MKTTASSPPCQCEDNTVLLQTLKKCDDRCNGYLCCMNMLYEFQAARKDEKCSICSCSSMIEEQSDLKVEVSWRRELTVA